MKPFLHGTPPDDDDGPEVWLTFFMDEHERFMAWRLAMDQQLERHSRIMNVVWLMMLVAVGACVLVNLAARNWIWAGYNAMLIWFNVWLRRYLDRKAEARHRER